MTPTTGKRPRGRPRSTPKPSLRPPAATAPVAGELRREVEVLAPSSTTTAPAVMPGGCVDPPAPGQPPLATSAQWRAFGPQLAVMMAPIYESVGATVPAPVLWEGFAESWGRVVDFYFPAGAGHPLIAAGFSTLIVGAPLALAIRERRRQLAEQKAQPQQEQEPPARVAAPADTNGSGGVDPAVFLGGRG